MNNEENNNKAKEAELLVTTALSHLEGGVDTTTAAVLTLGLLGMPMTEISRELDLSYDQVRTIRGNPAYRALANEVQAVMLHETLFTLISEQKGNIKELVKLRETNSDPRVRLEAIRHLDGRTDKLVELLQTSKRLQLLEEQVQALLQGVNK